VLDDRARAYAEAARAPATLRAYAADWGAFRTWCVRHAVDALPATPHTLTLFLADLPGRPATLRRKLAAIAVMHRSAGHDSPTAHAIVRATLAGICRERGIAPRPKTAMLVDELRAALATCGERTIDVRDRAIGAGNSGYGLANPGYRAQGRTGDPADHSRRAKARPGAFWPRLYAGNGYHSSLV
jgi:hypothetical protein